MDRYKDLRPGAKLRIDDEVELEPGVWQWARSFSGRVLVDDDRIEIPPYRKGYYGFLPEFEGKPWRRKLNDPETCKHFWIGLHPSPPSGQYQHCYECESDQQDETERCNCPESTSMIGQFTSGGFIPHRRSIHRGVCQDCRCIVRGMEDEADSDPDNW